MPRSTSLALLLLAACGGSGATPTSFVAPFDGQTGVPVDMPVLVAGGAAELPPHYPMDPLVRVTDLDGGGFVAGKVVTVDDDLWFEPADGWQEDHRYALTVDPPTAVPHGPELDVAATVAGTTAFDTSSAVRVVGAAMNDDQPCLVLSRPPDEQPHDVRVTANDVDLEDPLLLELSPDQWAPDFALPADDPGAGVYCIHSDTPVAAGAVLRVWWGDEEPARLELADETVEDVIVKLHRGTNP